MEASTSNRAAALASLKARRTLVAPAGEGDASVPTATINENPSTTVASGDVQQQLPPRKTVKGWVWQCQTCGHECVPIRSESRCLCGHRLKEHEKLGPNNTCRCVNPKCTCKNFFFIVAEGSWVLHCRCKHKHIDHDPVTRTCRKPKCACSGFDSPWVCNCDHPWADHKQLVVEREVKSLEEMMAEAQLAPDVNRWDLIERGRD